MLETKAGAAVTTEEATDATSLVTTDTTEAASLVTTDATELATLDTSDSAEDKREDARSVLIDKLKTRLNCPSIEQSTQVRVIPLQMSGH
jgi:hypothetical protein